MITKQVTLKSGKKVWEAVADGPADPVTGKRKQIRRRGKTKREAREKVEREIRKLESGLVDERTASKITFDQVANRWMEIYKLSGVKESTIMTREYTVKLLNGYFAKMPISSITHTKYQNVINELADEVSASTIKVTHSTAGLIFRQAIKDNIIAKNPASETTIPKKRISIEEIEKNKIKEKYLERDELDRLLNATLEHGLLHDKEWIYLLTFTGLRVGEMLALKWSDISFNTREIRITKTIYNPNISKGRDFLIPPKTLGSVRTITVEKEIIDILKKHKANQNKMKLQYQKNIDYHDHDLVFAKKNGLPYDRNFVNLRIKRLAKIANITKHVTSHFFRHTHVSMLAESGAEITAIMERVGHNDYQTTYNIYSHATENMKKDASEKIRKVYSDFLKNIN